MKTISLNYAREVSHSPIGMIFLATGVFLVTLTISALHFISLQIESTESNMQAIRHPHNINEKLTHPARLNQEKIKEIATTKTALTELAMPWQPLFKTLEKLNVPAVSLVAIEPNPKQHKLRVTANSRDIESMFAYVQSLRDVPILQEVSLVTHEYNPDNHETPVTFIVEAIWHI